MPTQLVRAADRHLAMPSAALLRSACARLQELAAGGRKEEKLADCVDIMRKLYTPLDSIHGAGLA